MSDILIKGMEMPKSCGVCNFYYVDYEEGTANCLATSCYVQPHHYHKDNRDPDCPLVEVPTPHGRLIDADEIEKCVHEWYDVGEYVFADTIRNADTIIEAEEKSLICTR